jgi:uncharacterized delta-60 repeat protein
MKTRLTQLLTVALFCALQAGTPAQAGPWEAKTPQGQWVRLEQDAFRTREGYVLTRRYADGSLDAQFGEQGSVVFSLGPDNEGPAALRLDPLGRIWVAGASAGSGDKLEAVVLRFVRQGQPDLGYARQGRSAAQPGGRPARALDLAPQADGSVYVVGLVTQASGQERSGWWRLLPNGSVDPAFGLGGVWVDPGAESTEILDFTPTSGDPRSGLSLRLRRGTAPDAPVETWQIAAGGLQPVRAASGVPAAAAVAPVRAASTDDASFRTANSPFAGPADSAPAVLNSPKPAGASEQPAVERIRLWGLIGLAVLVLVVAIGLTWLTWIKRRKRG